MDISTLDDQSIWEKIGSGKECCFEYIYNKYSDDLFRYGQKICKDRALVEDCIHDVFLHLWQNRKKVRIKSSIKFYLLKTFKRNLIKKLDQKKGVSLDLLTDSQNSLWENSIQELLLEKQILMESNKNVRNAINHLSERQREAIFLRYMEGLSYEKTAELMNMQKPSLYNLVQKAIANLANFLSDKQTFIRSMILGLFF